MGTVKIDIHKAEHQFHRVTFSDTECIKALIKFRSKIDSYIGFETNRNEHEAGDVKPMNQELLVLYIDLDNLITKTKLSEKQTDVLKKVMDGWTEADIADEYNLAEPTVIGTLDSICNAIKKTNDLSWKYDYMYMNHFKAPWSYKKCKSCGETKPLTSDFFSPNKSAKDGFRNVCKSCR